jgi:DNA repair exonuclease SbcCD nuclease subunit
MKIAVITDSHWGARNDNAAFAEYFKRFYQEVFFPKIDELGIDTVIHLGDLVDRRKYINYVTARNLEQEFMVPLRERGITTHLILGNHDTYYKNTNEVNGPSQLLKAYNELHIYGKEPVELEFDGTKVMLSPWICAENADATYKAFEDTKAQVLMGHFEIQGFEMMKGHLCDHGLDKNLFEKFDAVYSGHFHHPSSYNNITYLGAPYEMTWTDFEGKRGFHIFDTGDRSMTFVQNPLRMFHKIFYDDTDMTIEDVANLDTSFLTNTYIKVIVREKNNPYIFDLFLDRLQASGATDIKVVEDHMNLEGVDENDLLDEAQDTLTVLKQYVDGMEVKHDKSKIERCLRDLYQEAMSL